MITLAIASQKGGVGKTTLALNLSLALAERGWRTLLVDTDPQGGVGLSLQRPAGQGLVGYVAERTALELILLATRVPQLTLLPVGKMAIEDTHAFGDRLWDGHEIRRLVADTKQRFDVIVLDTPSGFGGITMGVMRASDAVISPLQAEPIAMRSVPQLLEVIGALRLAGSTVRLIGLVLSMLQLRNADSLAVAQEAWSEFPSDLLLQTTVPRDAAFLAASHLGVPVGLLSRRPPPVAATFHQLAQELEPRLGLVRGEENDGPIPLLA